MLLLEWKRWKAVEATERKARAMERRAKVTERNQSDGKKGQSDGKKGKGDRKKSGGDGKKSKRRIEIKAMERIAEVVDSPARAKLYQRTEF